MPTEINTVHTILTLITLGILIGAGWQCVALAFTVPSQKGVIAALLCLALVALAWVVR